MALDSGTRLGPYEIIAPLGQGGMGEVYRARDTRLDRIVAIKVLPSAVAADADLRARFEREARAISSLQHPHICTLFDVGEAPSPSSSAEPRETSQTVQYLVLEYLEGETLAERLARGGPLPLSEAMRLAIEVCDALDKAHRSGIVHRDLKPANVFLAHSGRSTAATAKLLDFGLAKTAAPVVATSSLSLLPTTPPNLTAQGTILGTFQYMAPEQIEGLEADARTDIFAFGAVVFEMITGRTAFEGKTRATLLGAILKDEPPAISTLQPLVPKRLDRAIATCLAKEPDDRWQSARDLLRELRWIESAEEAGTIPVAAARSAPAGRRLWMILLLGAVLVAALAGYGAARFFNRAVPAEALQFTIAPPPGTTLATIPGGGTGVAPQLAVSPDGRHLAFIANSERGYEVWVRSLSGVDARSLTGTQGASYPFWSPDSRNLGFFAGGKLKKVPLAGGPAVILCDAPSGRGGTWNRDNIILFTPTTSGTLQRVSAAGGTPTEASTLDTEYGETNHRFPSFLPDGRHFLFTATVGACCPAGKPGRLKVGALDTRDTTVIMQIESAVSYAAGHLLFESNGMLMAQPFDTSSRTLGSDAFPVAPTVSSEGSRYASVSAAGGSLLAYGIGLGRAPGQLIWVDRSGRQLSLINEGARFVNLMLSRDDRHIAATLVTSTGLVNRDIYVFDAATGAPTRFTFDAGEDANPVWSPDNRQIAFSSLRGTTQSLRQKVVGSAASDEPLLEGPFRQGTFATSDWSPDGRFILFSQSQAAPGGLTDIFVLPLSGDRKPERYVATPGFDSDATFSPDQKWVAFQTAESAQPEVYVQPFPATGGQFQISRNGGLKPVWRRDGKELFYFEPSGRMMAVAIDTAGGFRPGVPQPLFTLPTLGSGGIGRQYDVTGDGQRFIINTRPAQQAGLPLVVITNWLTSARQ